MDDDDLLRNSAEIPVAHLVPVNSAREREVQSEIDNLLASIRALEARKSVALESIRDTRRSIDSLRRSKDEVFKEIEAHCRGQGAAHAVMVNLEGKVDSIKRSLEDGPMDLLDPHQAPLLLKPWPPSSRSPAPSKFDSAMQALTPSQSTIYSNIVDIIKAVTSSMTSSSSSRRHQEDDVMKDLEDEDVVLPPASALDQDQGRKRGEILGPLLFLGAVERRAVAQALSFLTLQAAPGGLFTFVVRGDDAVRAVTEHFEVQLDVVSEWSTLDLEHESVVRSFNIEPCDALDSQMRLPMTAARKKYGSLLSISTSGFVGWAVNLIRFTDSQLAWSMTLAPEVAASLLQPSSSSGAELKKRSKPRQKAADQAGPSPLTLNLRQTLLSYLFGDAMVFETKSHLDAFVERCRRDLGEKDTKMKLISLDGRCYGNGITSQFATNESLNASATFGFSAVPSSDQLELPLDVMVESRVKEFKDTSERRNALMSLMTRGDRVEEDLISEEQSLQAREEEMSAADEALARERPTLEEKLTAARNELASLSSN